MSIFPGAPASSPSSSRSPSFLAISTGALSGLLLALGITRQSLWIDESYVAWIVARDDLLSMYRSAIALHLSDALMPFYIVGMSAWTRAFGDSELLLRLANLPFAVLFAAAMTALSAHLGRRWLWLPFLASPFLVFYMKSAVAICLTSCVLAFGVHIYSAFFLGSLVIFAGLEVLNSPGERQRRRRDWLKPLLISLPFFLLVVASDAYSFLHGSRGVKGSTSWKSLAFALYEFLGFAGLGPPRNDLRADPSPQAFAPYAALVVPALLVLLLCAWLLWSAPSDKDIREVRRERHLLLAGWIGLALATTAGYVLRFNMLGRHVASFFPLLACWFLLRLRGFASAPRLPLRLTVTLALLGIVWVISDLRLVLLPRYSKDDYRAAADLAVRAPGVVFWNADDVAGRYYGIYLVGGPSEKDATLSLMMNAPWPVRRRAIFPEDWTEEQLINALRQETAHGDALAVLSKPDLYDRAGIWPKVLPRFQAEKIAQPAAFEVWRIPRRTDRPAGWPGQLTCPGRAATRSVEDCSAKPSRDIQLR